MYIYIYISTYMYVCIICTYHWNWSLQTQFRLWVWNFWNPIIGHEASGMNLLGVECWIHLSQCIFWTCGLLQQSSIPQFIARFFEWESSVLYWLVRKTYHQCKINLYSIRKLTNRAVISEGAFQMFKDHFNRYIEYAKYFNLHPLSPSLSLARYATTHGGSFTTSHMYQVNTATKLLVKYFFSPQWRLKLRIPYYLSGVLIFYNCGAWSLTFLCVFQ